MISKKQLTDWLATLPEEDGISIDEGGLCLASLKEPDAYLEVGGASIHE